MDEIMNETQVCSKLLHGGAKDRPLPTHQLNRCLTQKV